MVRCVSSSAPFPPSARAASRFRHLSRRPVPAVRRLRCGGSSSKTRAAPSTCRRCRSAAASRPTIPATAPRPEPSPTQIIDAFEGYDAVVAPSGSCGGMLSHHYPGLFDDDPAMKARAEDLAGAQPTSWWRFLVDVLGVNQVVAALRRRRHLSRFLLRPARARRQAAAAPTCWARCGVSPCAEMTTPEVCCGFGGTFCVKYPEISNAMVGEKIGRYRGFPARARCWPEISAA